MTAMRLRPPRDPLAAPILLFGITWLIVLVVGPLLGLAWP